MKQYSISQLAREFGLSRSALLHYDAVGLLKPATRTSAGYRIYTDRECNRLRRICSLRDTGISLEDIRRIIDSDNTAVADILQERINRINHEIKALRIQQNIIVRLLGNEELLRSSRIMTKDMWVNLLASAGLDEDGMHKWHREFEKSAPEAHRDFLESLGLSEKEVKSIRCWAGKNE